jgi:hypothetical protein
VNDDATDDQIEELARDAMFELIEWTWLRVDKDKQSSKVARS